MGEDVGAPNLGAGRQILDCKSQVDNPIGRC